MPCRVGDTRLGLSPFPQPRLWRGGSPWRWVFRITLDSWSRNGLMESRMKARSSAVHLTSRSLPFTANSFRINPWWRWASSALPEPLWEGRILEVFWSSRPSAPPAPPPDAYMATCCFLTLLNALAETWILCVCVCVCVCVCDLMSLNIAGCWLTMV